MSFRAYCKEQGIKTLGKEAFGRRLKKLDEWAIEAGRDMLNGTRITSYRGVQLMAGVAKMTTKNPILSTTQTMLYSEKEKTIPTLPPLPEKNNANEHLLALIRSQKGLMLTERLKRQAEQFDNFDFEEVLLEPRFLFRQLQTLMKSRLKQIINFLLVTQTSLASKSLFTTFLTTINTQLNNVTFLTHTVRMSLLQVSSASK